MRVRYGRWSGTQDPFPVPVGADDVLSEIGDDLLAGMSPEQALRGLTQRGMRGRFAGLNDLRRRVEEARRRELERMGVEGPLRQVEARLEEILQRERTAVDYDATEAAQTNAQLLEDLPRDIASRLRALQDYPWLDRQAERDFNELLDSLRRDVADAAFGQLAGALGSMGPADVARMQELLGELNAMIAKQERGEDISQDFADFKQRHGDQLPGDPQSLDELLSDMARRMAAMSRLLAGMSPDQRAQLAQMAEQLLGDLELSLQASMLASSLQAMFPELSWGQPMSGAQPAGIQDGSLAQTVDWVEHLQSYEDLVQALAQDYPGARLEDIDEDVLRESLGADAVRDLRALRAVERALEEAGAVRRSAGRLELTPRGIRQLGERSLAKIYERAVGGPVGGHRTLGNGGDGELTGTTRPLRFGDPFRVDVTRTVRNALLRRAAEDPAAAGTGRRAVRLAPDDFELAEAERRVRAATVLLLDMSFSMPLRGNWVPAKRMALALQSLVSSKFPEDRFYVVGFSDYARRLQPRDLLAAGWERVYGTNMQHAFMIARRLLGAHPGTDQQVIMVTDGEPTAHLEGEVPFFAWPPEPKTLRLTLEESARLCRTGATLNVFLLDHDPGAAAFVEHMVSRYGGRIFYPDLDDLGTLVVRDFLSRRAG